MEELGCPAGSEHQPPNFWRWQEKEIVCDLCPIWFRPMFPNFSRKVLYLQYCMYAYLTYFCAHLCATIATKNSVHIACLCSAGGKASSVCEVSVQAFRCIAKAHAYYVRARITYRTVPTGSASRLAAIAGAPSYNGPPFPVIYRCRWAFIGVQARAVQEHRPLRSV